MGENKKRSGAWEEIERLQDPDSKVTLILSERIRGRHGYSIQICLEDDLGLNKHIAFPPKGAKHELKHIVYSLVEAADKAISKRKKKEGL